MDASRLIISNEERRRVAMSLRTAKQSELWRLSDGELIDTVADAIGVDGMSSNYEAAMFDRLADLIDRPTCRNIYAETEGIGGCENGFKCSECGNTVEDYEGFRISGEFNYCSKCGAEVVTDDD